MVFIYKKFLEQNFLYYYATELNYSATFCFFSWLFDAMTMSVFMLGMLKSSEDDFNVVNTVWMMKTIL